MLDVPCYLEGVGVKLPSLPLPFLGLNKSKSCRRLADYLRIGEEWADYFLVVASYPPVRFEKPPDLGPSVSIEACNKEKLEVPVEEFY